MGFVEDMRRWVLAQMEARLTRSGITSTGVDAGHLHGDIPPDAVTVDGSPIGSGGAHALVGAQHTVSGLTTGHVLTATGATAFAFQAPASGAGSAWSVLTNGDAAAPALIWDSFGQVVMCEVLRA